MHMTSGSAVRFPWAGIRNAAGKAASNLVHSETRLLDPTADTSISMRHLERAPVVVVVIGYTVHSRGL